MFEWCIWTGRKWVEKHTVCLHPISCSLLASFHWSSGYAFLQCKIMIEIWCRVCSQQWLWGCFLNLPNPEKLIVKLLCHKSGGSSSYLCMLVLNKLVLNRFLTGLLLQILGLAVRNITCPSCLQLNILTLLQNRGVSDQVR